MPDSLLDMTVRDLLDAAAARTPAPGGGGAAALTTALAAALAGMAARFGDGSGSVAEQADDATSRRHAPRRRGRRRPTAPTSPPARLPRDDPGRVDAIAAARSEAIAVPARIAELAGAVAELAADLARTGNPNLHGDATAAVHLAAAAATTAAELIAANVADDAGTAERDHAREIALAARRLAEAALRP